MAVRRTAWTNDRCTNISSARPPTPLLASNEHENQHWTKMCC